MDTYKSYTERIIQPTPIILGLKLLPFSLGMAILLKAADSKFLSGGLDKLTTKEIIVELVFGILVCSTTYDDFNEEINNGQFDKYVKKYVQELVGEINSSKEFNIFDKISQFANYLKAGTVAPLYEIKESDKNSVSSNPIEPEEAIISTLMTDCGYTRNECLQLPLTETLSAYLLHAFKQGAIDLVGKDVFALKKKMKGNHVKS